MTDGLFVHILELRGNGFHSVRFSNISNIIGKIRLIKQEIQARAKQTLIQVDSQAFEQ